MTRDPKTDMVPKYAIMKVTAQPVKPQGNLYGFASVKIGGIRIEGFRILADEDKRLFVGMPCKPDKSSSTGCRNMVYIDREHKDDFNNAVLRAHYDAVDFLMERTWRKCPSTKKRMSAWAIRWQNPKRKPTDTNDE